LLNSSLCLNFFSATCPKSKSKSNKFFHNFHLSKSSFTCPVPRASGLTRKLIEPRGSCLMKFNCINIYQQILYTCILLSLQENLIWSLPEMFCF
jgi:hypothetical protein